MLLEALILTVCINGYEGCSQSTSAYYKQSRELQAINKKVENISQYIIKDREWIVYLGSPIYSIAAHQPAKILVYKGTTLTINPWSNSVGMQWNF